MKWFDFGRQNRQRLEILQLTSLLCRWCQVRENLLYAFERCTESSLSPAFRQAIRDLITRIRGGMPPDEALAYFQLYSRQEHFQDLIAALRFNFRYRGHLPAMLELLEIQQNKLEEAYQHRKITNSSDLRLTAALLAAVPVLFGLRTVASPTIRRMLLSTGLGLTLCGIGLLFYAIAVTLFIQIFKRLRQ